MERLQKIVARMRGDSESSSSSSTFSDIARNFNRERDMGNTTAILDEPRLLVSRASRRMISLSNCSKLCAFFFVAGIFVGYTLKRRVRRWAGKLLRRLKDD